MASISKVIFAGVMIGLAGGSAHAQLKWEGCTDLNIATEIRKVILVGKNPASQAVDATLAEPIKLSIAKNGDVYFVERRGKVKVFKAASKTLKVVGALSVFTGTNLENKLPDNQQSANENGLTGIALDPNFETNGFVYLSYAPLLGDPVNISRFTVTNDVMDMASEKILIRVDYQRQACCHTGGAMQFDGDGNLFVTVGNNTKNPVATAADAYVNETNPNADDQGHSANTKDLRGKILRIRPVDPPVNGKYYTIPDGNLFPKEDTAKTRPEIWAMGLRNPYSLFVDKYRGWVAWGDVGPDEGKLTEEWNVFTKPGNGGWPYFAGEEANPVYRYRLNKNPLAPENNSPNNTGLTQLPPARGATIGYLQSAAITGPIYHYDGALNSTVKMPPHFNKIWFVTDYNRSYVKAVVLNDTGKFVSSREIFAEGKIANPLQMDVGPDGAFYVVEYGHADGGNFVANKDAAISRLEYTGACRPLTPVPVGLAGGGAYRAKGAKLLSGIHLGWMRDIEVPAGMAGLRLFDIRGQVAWEYARTGLEATRVTLPQSLAMGVFRVEYTR